MGVNNSTCDESSSWDSFEALFFAACFPWVFKGVEVPGNRLDIRAEARRAGEGNVGVPL